MGQRAIDMTGQKIGALTVVGRTVDRGAAASFQCLCECGASRVVKGGDLRRRFIVSCGCKINGKPRGIGSHPLYGIHTNMLDRCENPESKDYPRYGGRGIKVCAAWHDIEKFAEGIGPRPSASHSVDRIDNSGDYEPGNCRWATASEQGRNRRNNYFPGQTSVEVCQQAGVNPGTFRTRVSKGWTIEEALDATDHRRRHN